MAYIVQDLLLSQSLMTARRLLHQTLVGHPFRPVEPGTLLPEISLLASSLRLYLVNNNKGDNPNRGHHIFQCLPDLPSYSFHLCLIISWKF